MRYEQPNVILLGTAAAVVQFQGIKPAVSPADNENPGDLNRSDGTAYQADE